MPNKRESIEMLVQAIIESTGLEMINKIFRDSGLSNQTIEALVEHGIDSPERVLFMTEAQLRIIGGVPMRELRAYRARFISDSR